MLAWPTPAKAQEQEKRPSGLAGFFEWLFNARQPPSAEATAVHENAESIATTDTLRETALERKAAEERIAADKFQILLELRTDRDRRVAGAKAKASVPFAPLRPKSTTPVLLASAGAVEGPTTPAIDPSPPSLPASPAAPRPAVIPKTNTPAAVVDQVVQQVGSQIIGTPEGKPLSPGLFALVLIGLFLVPAAGITLLLLGIAHLRGHSFLSGLVILAIGGLFLWGTWSLARTVSPDLLTGSRQASRDLPETADLRPMQALQPDILWNNE